MTHDAAQRNDADLEAQEQLDRRRLSRIIEEREGSKKTASREREK